jgi:hypothetical protein
MKKFIFPFILIMTIASAEEVITEQHDIPYKGEEELEVNIGFGLGEIELRGGDNPDFLLRSEMKYAKDFLRPIVEYKTLGNRGRLRLHTEKFNKGELTVNKKDRDLRSNRNQNHWRLEFTRRVPIYYSIELGMGSGQLDFTGQRVRDLKLECGLSDVQVDFQNENRETMRALEIGTGLGSVTIGGLGYANMERFNVECGLGSTDLVFNGNLQQDIRGKIEVGLGSVRIDIPDNIAVEVRAESSFLSSLNLHGFDRVGNNLYRSGNWRTAKKTYHYGYHGRVGQRRYKLA